MTAVSAYAPAVARRWWRRAQRRPLPLLPWAIATVAAAWLLVAAAFAAGHGAVFGHEAGAAGAAGWVVMTVAMMGPSCLPMARYVAANTLVPGRAVAAYAGGFVAAWALALAAFGVVDAVAHAVVPPLGARGAAAAFAGAAAWQLTPWKREALRACRRVGVLPAHPGRAERAAARLGLGQGGSCVTSCGPLMLAAMAAPYARLPVMAAVAVLVWLEKAGGLGRRLALPSAGALVAVAAAYLAVG